MRVAIYARTSAIHGPQEVEKQLKKLRTHCRRSDWLVVDEYTDWRSGDRQNFDRMVAAAAVQRDLEYFKVTPPNKDHRGFRLVLFWDLDHLPANNVAQIHSVLQGLSSLGVEWRSHSDDKFNTHSYYDGKAILAALNALQKYENRKRRISALKGVSRARRESTKLGSEPKVTVEQFREATARLQKQKDGRLRAIEKLGTELGISRATVYRLIKRAR